MAGVYFVSFSMSEVWVLAGFKVLGFWGIMHSCSSLGINHSIPLRMTNRPPMM